MERMSASSAPYPDTAWDRAEADEPEGLNSVLTAGRMGVLLSYWSKCSAPHFMASQIARPMSAAQTPEIGAGLRRVF